MGVEFSSRMRAGLIVLVVFATLDGISTLPRNEKNLAIFNVVKFKNEPCYSTSETMNNGNRNGTCFTSTECEEKNGRAEGNCASGFGICCVFTKETCGEKVNQNSTYIRNEDYPTAVTLPRLEHVEGAHPWAPSKLLLSNAWKL